MSRCQNYKFSVRSTFLEPLGQCKTRERLLRRENLVFMNHECWDADDFPISWLRQIHWLDKPVESICTINYKVLKIKLSESLVS